MYGVHTQTFRHLEQDQVIVGHRVEAKPKTEKRGEAAQTGQRLTTGRHLHQG